MTPAHPATALSLSAVELDGVSGDPGYLEALPFVRHVQSAPDGGLVVWLEPANACAPSLTDEAPARPADVELHGPGAPCEALIAHPRAQHVEMFFDGLGDPVFAPRGWWHARVWLRPAA
jgi:hypothetical protein